LRAELYNTEYWQFIQPVFKYLTTEGFLYQNINSQLNFDSIMFSSLITYPSFYQHINICFNNINYAANPCVDFSSILSLTPRSNYCSQQTLPPASHAGDLGPILCQAMWYVWCTKLQRNRLFSEYFNFSCQYHCITVPHPYLILHPPTLYTPCM
jgi:hypothetical protein